MSARMPDIETDTGDPRDAAAAWFSRERSGEMTAGEALDLQVWLDADAAHRTAYAEIRHAWGEAAAVRADPKVMAIREHWLATQAHRRRRSALRAMAAGLVAMVMAGAAELLVYGTAVRLQA